MGVPAGTVLTRLGAGPGERRRYRRSATPPRGRFPGLGLTRLRPVLLRLARRLISGLRLTPFGLLRLLLVRGKGAGGVVVIVPVLLAVIVLCHDVLEAPCSA